MDTYIDTVCDFAIYAKLDEANNLYFTAKLLCEKVEFTRVTLQMLIVDILHYAYKHNSFWTAEIDNFYEYFKKGV